MRSKIDVKEILALKLANRVCRKKVDTIPIIMEIVQECCDYLKMPVPKVLFCESLAKDFQSFALRDQSYFIYDACLLEVMNIYTTCGLAGFLDTDLEKLFMKLIAEELIVSRDLPSALYFTGHYHRKQYSFENRIPAFEKCSKYLTFQSYFLIAHELTHLSLLRGRTIPLSFREFISKTICSLMERYSDEARPFGNNLRYYSMFFFQKNQATLDDFVKALPDSIHFQHLLEESYCDYMGLKLLVENYAQTGVAMNAVFSALNCLFDIEVIRDELRNGLLKRNADSVFNEVSITTFFSVLRMGIASYVSRLSNLTDVIIQDHDMQWERSTDRLISFLKELPDGKSFAKVADMKLPTDEKTVISYLLRQLYYSSVS